MRDKVKWGSVELRPAETKHQGNVVPFKTPPERTPRPDPLTDDEVRRLRAMLDEFDTIKQSCPMARRLLEGE